MSPMISIILAGALLLLLTWAVCRTPASARDAENRRARQLAERGQNQALFGHPHHPGNGEEPTE